jgi:hypothetical protein
MKRILLYLYLTTLLYSCNNNDTRDVLNANDTLQKVKIETVFSEYLSKYKSGSIIVLDEPKQIHSDEAILDTSIFKSFTIINLKTDSTTVVKYIRNNNEYFLNTKELVQLKHIPNYDFINFLKHFYTDKEFQKSHIKFPYIHITDTLKKTSNIIIETKGELTELKRDYNNSEKVDSNSWKYIDFTEFDTNIIILDNRETNSTLRFVKLFNTEHNMYNSMKFELMNSEWKLISIE